MLSSYWCIESVGIEVVDIYPHEISGPDVCMNRRRQTDIIISGYIWCFLVQKKNTKSLHVYLSHKKIGEGMDMT